MNRFAAAVLAALVLVILTGCKKKENTETAPPADTTAVAAPPRRSMPDSVQLMLIDRVPLGITYQDARVLLNGIGPKRSKGIAELSEAKAPTRVFDHAAVVDLEFDNDRLYAYFFRIEDLACPSSDSIYTELQGFYDRQFGPHKEEQLREGGYQATNSFWSQERFNVVATKGRQGSTCRIAWGFQLP